VASASTRRRGKKKRVKQPWRLLKTQRKSEKKKKKNRNEHQAISMAFSSWLLAA